MEKWDDNFKKFEFVEFLFVAGRVMGIAVLLFFMLFQGVNSIKVNLALLLVATFISLIGLIFYRNEKENGLLIYYIGVLLQGLFFIISALINKHFQITVLIFFILPLLMGISLIEKRKYSK
jgi:hypothetical protein